LSENITLSGLFLQSRQQDSTPATS